MEFLPGQGDDALINPESIKVQSERVLSELQQPQNDDPLIAKTANEWIEQAKSEPIPKMLFSEFWHQGEACILFADTGAGKSILAMQIANSICNGVPIDGFKMEAEAQPVLYLDFELSPKQFQNRYSVNYEQDYNFSNNFIRVEMNPDAPIPADISFGESIELAIERLIIEKNIRILVVDNLTYLQPETEKTKEAWALMNNFKRLRNRYKLSILALAHTPKRDASKPIIADNIQGSKNMANFCDSAFTIGDSAKDPDMRYIKQIKQRATGRIYGGDNICTCEIYKPHNFVHFRFLYHGTEAEHLKQLSDEKANELQNNILTLHKEGRSLREIGKQLNITHTRAERILKRCIAV